MDWSHPQILWPILPLSFAWLALALVARSRRRQAVDAFVAAGMRPRIVPADSPARFWIKALLWEVGLVCSLVALAGPRFGTYFEHVKPRGADLYVAIDVSRSMLATDVLPSRLGRAKADVADLLQHLNGERVALLAFAGKAAVRCPLTTDYGYFRKELNDLDTTSAPRGGTAIGDAIRKALEVLPQDPSRDQAILLITDGEDHESRPELAAEAAAERRVAIFTVGLGDAAEGAPVPKAQGDGGYLEYKGQQVRSRLDNKILEKIALLTGGAHIPAGTQQYNLGQLYENHLKQLRAGTVREEKRLRRSEQYQVFLGIGLLALLLEMLIGPYPRPVSDAVAQLASAGAAGATQGRTSGRRRRTVAAAALFLAIPCGMRGGAQAEEPARADARKETPPARTDEAPPYKGSPRSAVNEGLAAYREDKFDLARQRFAQAAELLKKKDRENLDAAIAAFDLACALHRKDSREQAQSEYLTASLSRDKELSAAAHYNLGCLAAEQARGMVGEDPLKLEPAKRTEAVEKLKEAAQSFRRCLDIAPHHADARRNLELVRQWVKYWSDKWRELDREKRRKESPLLEYLDYLIATEKALHEEVRHYESTTPLDALVEAKRLQTELYEELDPFKARMKDELAPRQELSTPGVPGMPQPSLSDEERKKKEEADRRQAEALSLLLNWVDAAGQKMKSAMEYLSARKPQSAATDQKAAADQLESVWEALVPFHPLLQRELDDQTAIAGALAPEPPPDEKDTASTARPKDDESRTFADDELAKLADAQVTAARRALLLKLKADQELKETESLPPQQAQPATPGGPPVVQPGQPDPEKLKQGYRKAIELAPKAMEKMSSAADLLREKQPGKAHPDAEEARKILEEIAKAFEQEKQQNENPQKQDPQDRKDQDKKDEQKQNEEQQKEQREQQMSRDRMEAMLRQVREREKLKERRDRELKAYLMGSDGKVEKDW